MMNSKVNVKKNKQAFSKEDLLELSKDVGRPMILFCCGDTNLADWFSQCIHY